MLVLNRKRGSSIIIGDEIEITVIHVGRDRVRLAIDAPKRIPIVRAELLDGDVGQRPAGLRGFLQTKKGLVDGGAGDIDEPARRGADRQPLPND